MLHLSEPIRKEIQLVLGNKWQFAKAQPFGEDAEEVLGWSGVNRKEMIGRFILYRWTAGPKNQTKDRWFVGKVVQDLLDSADVEEGYGMGRCPKNFKVKYEDGYFGQSLGIDRCLNYTLKQSPGATWWVLLEEKSLHSLPQSGVVLPPQKPSSRGRPKTARCAPPAGTPTSKKKKK